MNQTPEEIARDKIDLALINCGWIVQNKKEINLNAATGVAVREYLTNVGSADYVLFVNKKPVSIIEAKREEEAVRLTEHEHQSGEYDAAKLKYLDNLPDPDMLATEIVENLEARLENFRKIPETLNYT
jgi:type I restriction enzyme, R subunit